MSESINSMVKQIFTFSFLLMVGFGINAQNAFSQNFSSQKRTSHHKNNSAINLNGQWKGGFQENSFGLPGYADNGIKYVLELSVDGSKVSGYSYTYFEEGMKRYYTICRLTGTFDNDSKDLVVTEIERTKFNTPPDFQNCFQTHRLHYERNSDEMEVLKGTWLPAPNQGRGCGTGTTVLSRRIVNNLPTGFMPHENKQIAKAATKKPTTPQKSIAEAPAKSTTPAKKIPEQNAKIENPEPLNNVVPAPNTTITKSDITNQSAINPSAPSLKGFETRKKNIIKTISITQPTFHLSFYDNGEIDGDSITVFYNGKAVLSHQRLSDKPVSLTLTLDQNVKENIVTMYADNLGTIPPNTALMIVTDGTKRYEVRIESDTEKSGSVVFTHE
ncbi:MAG: hypothetical protein ABI325_06345 [Ginsengibacter sp.]